MEARLAVARQESGDVLKASAVVTVIVIRIEDASAVNRHAAGLSRVLRTLMKALRVEQQHVTSTHLDLSRGRARRNEDHLSLTVHRNVLAPEFREHFETLVLMNRGES